MNIRFICLIAVAKLLPFLCKLKRKIGVRVFLLGE